ncbi:zinc finger, CCHC-type containing protein, partial [Tanacetum coccineum]
MDSLVSNNTWELSDLPFGSKAIRCRWVFRIKYHTDGSIQTFKARLVIQGFSQRKGADYFDTYAPLARITLIRVLFALALIYNLPIHQMDAETVLLNSDLDEQVYMKQPKRFVFPGHENKVCKLKKSLYGLKQAPKQWHDKFDKSILSNDDILNVGTNMEGVNETKKFLSSCIQMKDMNGVDTILGIKVKRHNASWITGSSDSKSITGWIFTLSGGAVCWGSKKQTCITHSTMEAEFLALAAAGKEAEWLRNMLLEIELWPNPMPGIL